MLKRRLLSAGFWALIGKAGILLNGVLINVLLARLLSPQDMGAYFVAFNIVSFGGVVGTLGLNQAVVRFVAESIGLNQPERARKVIFMVLKTVTIGALVIGSTYFFLGGFIGAKLFKSPALFSVTRLIAVWMVTVTLQRILSEIFRGLNDIRMASLLSGVTTGCLFVVGLILLWSVQAHAKLDAVLILAVVSGTISSIIAGWLLRAKMVRLPHGRPISLVKYSELLHVSTPIFVTNLIIFLLTQGDIWIVGAFLSQEQVAIYGAASRLAVLLSMPLGIVYGAIQPTIAELFFQKKNKELERVLRTTATLAGIPLFLTLIAFLFFGEQILGFIYGDFYRKGAIVLSVLCIGHMVNVWAGTCGLLLNMTGHHNPATRITFFSVLLAAIISLAVVNNYGVIGVAAATAFGYICLNIALVVYGIKVLGIKSYMSFSPKFIFKIISLRGSMW